jgi:hypothetical protein
MSKNRLPGRFFGRQIGETKWPADMNKMVEYWINTLTGSDKEERAWSLQLANDLREEDPDLSLDLIIAVLKRDPPQSVSGQLAASVLEDLLIEHGAAVIDRVEAEARRDRNFHHLLGGMYQDKMSDEIRSRVNQLCPEKW